MKRVVLYARVSTVDKGQDTRMQLRELREFCAARDWKIVAEYKDHCSGAKEKRPALNSVMADAKQRKFDVIAVWKLDRFGRSLKHLVTAIAELDALGVVFVSLKDGFDMSTPSGRAMFGMCAVMAEFERAMIAERVRSGIASALADGRTWKRGPNHKYKGGKPSRTTLWRQSKR